MPRDYFFEDNKLYLRYEPALCAPDQFVDSVRQCNIERGNRYPHSKTFNLNESDVERVDDYYLYIVIGRKSDSERYYYLDKEIFDIDYNFAFCDRINVTDEMFVNGTFSVIKEMSNTFKADIFIDSDEIYVDMDGHIPFSVFKELCSKFPNNRELLAYRHQVLENLIGDFFDKNFDYRRKYEELITKIRKKEYTHEPLLEDYALKRKSYLETYLTKIELMLKNNATTESDWQNTIADLLLVLYPKYLVAIPKSRIESLNKIREIDFLMVDNDGNIDIVEIKKAAIGNLLRKNPYRSNYIPTRELTGSIIQVEKYIYYLQSSKESVQKQLNERNADILCGIDIKIVHPQAIIIAGRSDLLNPEELEDLEIVRRMYKNIAEIMTYDTLIKRIKNEIAVLDKGVTKVVDDRLPF